MNTFNFPEDFDEIYAYVSHANEDVFGKTLAGNLVIYYFDNKNKWLMVKTHVNDNHYNQNSYSKDGKMVDSLVNVAEPLD